MEDTPIKTPVDLPLNTTPAPRVQTIRVVLIVAAILAALFTLFVAGLFTLIEFSFRNSFVYQEAIRRARADSRVAQQLGVPIEARWMTKGNIQMQFTTGSANLAIPVRGQKRSGMVYLVAERTAGEWHYQLLQVEIEGLSERIDLPLTSR